MSETAYPTLVENLRWRQVGDEILVLHTALKQYHILNSVASDIWQLSDGKHTTGEIVDHIAKTYDHDRDEVFRDVAESLEGFVEMQLISLREEAREP